MVICVRPSLFFRASVRQYVLVYPSVMISPPKPLDRIQPNCYITYPHGKGGMSNIIFLCARHLSISSKPLGGLQSNLLFLHFPLTVRVCESNIIFCACIIHQYIGRSRFLLNNWAEFNQTCYMSSSLVRVCKSNLSPSVYLSVSHAISNISKERGNL